MFVPTVAEAKLPTTWDNLVKIDSKRLQAVYILPDADFRPYTKVMLDPAEVAFQKNWQRDYNSSTGLYGGLSRRITDKDASEIAKLARDGFDSVMAKAYTKAGYQVVTTPGPDVLRIISGVINLSIRAPDTGAGRSRSYSAEAGEATVIIEARDSLTNAILGRAADLREAGDLPGQRTSATNRADFLELFEDWANASVRGLNELKAISPVDTDGLTRR